MHAAQYVDYHTECYDGYDGGSCENVSLNKEHVLANKQVCVFSQSLRLPTIIPCLKFLDASLLIIPSVESLSVSKKCKASPVFVAAQQLS